MKTRQQPLAIEVFEAPAGRDEEQVVEQLASLAVIRALDKDRQHSPRLAPVAGQVLKL